MRPLARSDVLVQELGDEGLLYDFATHRAHCLDRGALAVWRRCDGKRGLIELAELVSTDLSSTVGVPWVRTAVQQLSEAGLLEAEVIAPRASRRLARRRVVAGAALALPAVWSILSPSVAQAASSACLPPASCMGAGVGTCCGTSGQAAMSCSAAGVCGGSGLLCPFTCR